MRHLGGAVQLEDVAHLVVARNRAARLQRNAGLAALPVCMLGVWHSAQPVMPKTLDPFEMERPPPGLVVEGVGAFSNRMKIANFSTSLSVSDGVAASRCVVSFGTAAN